jgi:hypothetical protein
MRELTKAASRFSLAMSLFGVQQMTNLLTGRASRAFNTVTDSTREQLGDALDQLYRAGDQWQGAMVDMMFGVFGMGMGSRGMGNGRGTGGMGGMGGGSRRGCGCPSGRWGTGQSWSRDDRSSGAPQTCSGQKAGGQWGDQPEAPTGWGPVPTDAG